MNGASPCLSACSTFHSLLLLPESEETDTRDLDDLETDTGDISLGLAAATETRDEDLVVLVGKVEATVVGHERGYLLAVLDELDTDTLADSRVGLLGLDTDLGLVKFAKLVLRAGFRLSTPPLPRCTQHQTLLLTFSRTMPLAWDEPPVGEVL